MAGPGDEVAAGAEGRGRLRASHADREHVIDTLKVAFVQGRLDRGEFGLRMGQALASQTCAELAYLTADLPAGLAAARSPQPTGEPGEPRISRPGRVLTMATVAYAAVWMVAFILPNSGPDHDPDSGIALAGTATLIYMLLLLMTGTPLLADWLNKHW